MATFDKKSGAIWIAASQIVLLASNFLLLKLLTTQLSIGSFGYYSLCMSIVLFARQLLYDSVSIVVAKECASTVGDHQRISDGFRNVRFLTDRVGLALLLAGLLSWFFAYVLNDIPIEGIVIWSCAVYLCANGAQGIYFNVLNSISDRKPAAVFSMFDSILKVMLVLLAFWFFENSLVYTLLPISFGAFAVFLGVRLFVKKKFASFKSSLIDLKTSVKHSLLMSMPLYFPILLTAFKSVADRWILAAFMGVDDLAAFSVLLQLGYFPMLVFFGMVQTFVAPNVYRLCALKSGNGFGELKRYIHKLVLRIFILSCAAVGVSLGLADWIFQLLVGRDYYVFSIYLPLFVVSGALAAVGGILHVAVIGIFETRVVGRLMIMAVVISVASASLLIVALGFVGAVAGLVIASAASAFIYWLALYRDVFRLA